MTGRMGRMMKAIGVMALGSVVAVWPAAAAAQVKGGDSATPEVTPTVTMTRGVGNRILVAVNDGDVSIRKDVGGTGSHVTITTPKDELHLRVEGTRMTVSTPSGTVSVSSGDQVEVGRLMAVLQRSDAAARGLAVLKRIPFDGRHFGQQTLLLTRVVLETGAGYSPAHAEYRRWVQSEQERRIRTRGARVDVPRIVPASLADQQMGPGECWDKYVEEIARIARDYEECTAHLKWYHALDWIGCSLIFTIRAEGTALWYINCVGGLPFIG